jgi:uncharacterized phosphosugar-binding protein
MYNQMSSAPDSTVAGEWTRSAIELMERIQHTQASAIAEAARWSAEAIADDGFVHMFGSGHSRIAVEEMFPRYGSFPGFNPMVELSTSFHTQVVGSNGQRQAMFIERVSGLADAVMANFAFRPKDVLMVFSVSGTSAVPVELAQIARQRGLRTIAVTSVAHSSASESSTGIKLMDVADLVIDIGTPPGDALVSIPGFATPVGPGSTAATVAVVNEIKAQTAEILVRQGIHPPVLTGPMVVGEAESKRLFDAAYDDHAKRISRTLGDVGAIRDQIRRRTASPEPVPQDQA